MADTSKKFSKFEPAFQFLGIDFIVGSGTPNAVVTAPKGSFYLNTGGTTTNDRAYINTDGSTAWTAVTTAS
jgi:hypothetical protein